VRVGDLVLSGETSARALCVLGGARGRFSRGSTFEVLVRVAVESVVERSFQELGVEGFYACGREVCLLEGSKRSRSGVHGNYK
jgi:hypothetical protein